MNAREYREHLYRERAHPEIPIPEESRSFAPLYLSLIPFLILEYVTELRYANLPSGIIFPAGFLLFWAFYYTYEQPGVLEKRLSSPKRWDFFTAPTVLMGSTILFVKVTIIEFTEVVVMRWLLGMEKSRPQKRTAKAPPQNSGPRRATRLHERPTANPSPSSAPALPSDIAHALTILGLDGCRDWERIHKRYRELAKRYHPDLNPDGTQSGQRFIVYDAAYRKLAAVKTRYFS